MSFQIEFTKSAKEDLNDIYSYIAFTLFSPDVAVNMYHSIIDGIRSLNQLPFRNAVINDEPWENHGLRKCFIKNYTVFYESAYCSNHVQWKGYSKAAIRIRF